MNTYSYLSSDPGENENNKNDFWECFKNQQCRWDHFQASEGDYSESDTGPYCLR
jgi:hypothetical protein